MQKSTTYRIGEADYTLAKPTPRQQKYLTRLNREATQAADMDAKGNDNLLIIFSVLWSGLVEIEKVTEYLAVLIVPQGDVWSEDLMAKTKAVLDAEEFASLSDLFQKAVADFFANEPRLSQPIMISVLSSIKGSARLMEFLEPESDRKVAALSGLTPVATA